MPTGLVAVKPDTAYFFSTGQRINFPPDPINNIGTSDGGADQGPTVLSQTTDGGDACKLIHSFGRVGFHNLGVSRR